MKKPILLAIVTVIVTMTIIAVVADTNTTVQLHQVELKTKQQEIEIKQKQQEALEQELIEAEGNKKKLKQIEQKNKQLQDEIKRLQAKKAEEARIAAQQENVAYASPEAVTEPSGTCSEWMAQAGISNPALAYEIFMKESGCSPTASNPSSAAHGVCQSLPASKMATHGSDYLSNPITQMRWCESYAMARYGSWESAWQFWQENKWW